MACDYKVRAITLNTGKVSDWYKANKSISSSAEDPGTKFVCDVFNYVHASGYGRAPNIIATRFHTKEQIVQVAGCDIVAARPRVCVIPSTTYFF